MKVLGCVLGDIRAVFLIEAGLIGLLGGLIGDALSSLASFLFNRYGGSLGEILGGGGGGYYRGGGEEVVQRLSVIPPWLLLLGLVFATCVGLVSGILPAMRAVKISALEAIRTE
jgi:ABC-type lipoprotein release transport system permease subunit